MIILIVVVYYLVGWLTALAISDPQLFNLYDLLKEEQSPENSLAIRELASKTFTKWFFALVFGGYIAWIVLWLAVNLPPFLQQTAELKRRLGKVKRGYGIKPDDQDAETEADPASLEASYQAKAYRNSR